MDFNYIAAALFQSASSSPSSPSSPVSHADLLLAAALSMLATLVTIIGYLIKRRLEVYDKHLDECRERAIATGRMEERLKTVEYELVNVRRSVHWLGNCMQNVAVKIGADIPDRPV